MKLDKERALDIIKNCIDSENFENQKDDYDRIFNNMEKIVNELNLENEELDFIQMLGIAFLAINKDKEENK